MKKVNISGNKGNFVSSTVLKKIIDYRKVSFLKYTVTGTLSVF